MSSGGSGSAGRESRDDGDVVSVHRIEVVDEAGRVRMEIGMLPRPDGAHRAGVSLLDRQGHERALLMLDPDFGPMLDFTLEGNQVLALGARDDHLESTYVGSFLYLCAPDGAAVYEWRGNE